MQSIFDKMFSDFHLDVSLLDIKSMIIPKTYMDLIEIEFNLSMAKLVQVNENQIIGIRSGVFNGTKVSEHNENSLIIQLKK